MGDDRSEKAIQGTVRASLEAVGYSVWNLSQPRATKQTEGLPDLIAVGRGRVVFIEMKSARGKQTKAQLAFQHAVQANKGHYLVVRSMADIAGLAEP